MRNFYGKTKARILLFTGLALLSSLTGSESVAGAQRRVNEQDRLARQFSATDDRCRDLLRARDWTEAVRVCSAAARLADQFSGGRELERMGAYEMVGHALMGLNRYQEALDRYTRALEFVRTRLTEANAELGRLYGNIAIAHHSLRNLDAALEFYRKATRSLYRAYTSINPEEIVRERADELTQSYLRSLKTILEHYLLAAEQAGTTAEIEEIRRLMRSLP